MPYPSPGLASSFPPSPGFGTLFTPDAAPYSPYSQPATPFMNQNAGDSSSPAFVSALGFEVDGREDSPQGNESNTDISSYLNQNSPFISFGTTVPYEGGAKPPQQQPQPRPQHPHQLTNASKQKEEEGSFGCLQELLQFEPLKKEEGMKVTAAAEQAVPAQTPTEELNRKEGEDYTPNDEEVEKEFEDIMMDSTDGTFNSFYADEEKP